MTVFGHPAAGWPTGPLGPWPSTVKGRGRTGDTITVSYMFLLLYVLHTVQGA